MLTLWLLIFQEYLEMQRQLALQRLQEQEREMQMRFEQQRQLTQIRQMQNYGYNQVEITSTNIRPLKTWAESVWGKMKALSLWIYTGCTKHSLHVNMVRTQIIYTGPYIIKTLRFQ